MGGGAILRRAEAEVLRLADDVTRRCDARNDVQLLYNTDPRVNSWQQLTLRCLRNGHDVSMECAFLQSVPSVSYFLHQNM